MTRDFECCDGAHDDDFMDATEIRELRDIEEADYLAMEARAQQATFPSIPDELCGRGGCTYLPHSHVMAHSWADRDNS